MTIEESVFEGYRADFEALAAHGFAEREGAWTFTVPIPKTDFTTTVRVDAEGKVTGRVTFVREDGRVDMSLREVKEKAMITDSERILALLEKRQGTMPYSDATPPEIIKDAFGISKAAFKRALGKLMKEGKITQENGWTSLVK